MSLASADPSLSVVDRWLDRREHAGAALSEALALLAERRLTAWARGASEDLVGAVQNELRRRGVERLGAHLVTGRSSGAVASEQARDTERARHPGAVALLRRITNAQGAEAFENVEQAFRRSIAKFGARFVASHARAAIDDTMGPMHSTVVAAELLSMLERLDPTYLESLTFSLETMHDWGVVAARVAESPDKTQANPKRRTRALSSTKRRA